MTPRTLASIGAVFLLSACAAGTDYQRPTVQTAPAWRGPPSAPAEMSETWWRAFNDPALDGLVEMAIAQNLDLEQAYARVDQALAALRHTRADLLPSGVVEGSAGRTRQSTENGLGRLSGLAPGFNRTVSQYSLTTMASWELDFAGGLRRSREAAGYEAGAAASMARAARLTVAAEAADAYVQLRALQAQLAHARQRMALAGQTASLVALREKTGDASVRELEQASANASEARAAIPPIEAAIEAQLNRLAVLTGREPQADRLGLDVPAAIPSAALGNAGAPADLLRRRPDIIAAEQRLAAAHARIGAALAEYYPKFSLSALLGFQSNNGSALLTSRANIINGTAGLRWRLFDFKRIDAEVDAARGAEREALAAYRQAVLRAAEEVETNFAVFAAAAAQRSDVMQQITAAERSHTLARRAWDAGEVSLLEVITAEQQLISARMSAVASEASAARAWIACRRALGG